MGCVSSQQNHSILQLERIMHINRKRGSSIDNYTSCFKFGKFIEKVHKTYIQLSVEDKQLLNKTFAEHILFYRLPKSERNRVIQHIQVYECQEQIKIFQKGESATLFFIIRSGNVQIITNSTTNNKQQRILLSRGNYFGDLALLYTAVRSATAKSLNKCTFFCVPNYLFKQITQQMSKKNYELAKDFIEKTTIFNYLSKRQKNVIAYNTLFLRYQKNQQIFHEGDDSNSLYVVTAGVVQIRIARKLAIEMRPGDSFGQSSFKQNQTRSGTAVATQLTSLLSISRQSLCKCLGKQLQQIQFYNILKWAFNRNQLLKKISKLQKERLINSAELRQYQNQQIICREGQKIEQIIIVLEQKINDQEVGAIFNIEYLTTQFQTETKITRNLIKNGKGFIASVSFKSLNSVLGKILRKILPISSQNTQYQLICEDIDKVELSDLTIRQLIEENQFSKVYCVIDHMEKVYAIKCISKESIQARNMELYLLHEKQLMETLQFSFIIKLYKTFKDERFVYFLTNYIEGVDFLDVLQQVGVCNKKKAQFFIGCLILCLEYLHEKNIIYRDLKPENIVVENSGFLYLNNFQIAKILRQQAGYRTFTVVGTPHYMAPQIISASGYSFPIDIWSLGVMLFEMLFGYFPFGNDSEDPYLIFKQIDTKELVLPTTYEDYAGEQLLLKLLSKNPSDRSVQQFAKLKAMPYFDNFDWDSLQKRVIQTPFKIKSKNNKKILNKYLIDTLKQQKIVSNKQSQNTIWNDF